MTPDVAAHVRAEHATGDRGGLRRHRADPRGRRDARLRPLRPHLRANHLRRSLEILETLGTLEGFNDSQEDLKRGSAAMSHEARKRLATPSWSRDAFSVHLQDEERVDRSILGARLMQGRREAGRVYLPHACVLRLCCSCELLLRSRRDVRVIRLLGATARPSVR